MARRYFLTRIVTRNIDGEPVTDPAIALLRKPNGQPYWPQGTRMWYAPGPEPQAWALVLVDVAGAGQSAVPVPPDPDVYPLPDFPLDGKLSAIHLPTMSNLSTYMEATGIDTGIMTQSEAFRELLRRIGRLGDPNFDENRFGAA